MRIRTIFNRNKQTTQVEINKNILLLGYFCKYVIRKIYLNYDNCNKVKNQLTSG